MSKQRAIHLRPYMEENLRRAAHIFGPSCAAAKALSDLEARRAVGEQPAIYLDQRGSIIVGPQIPTKQGVE
jgi:hypothetical protein